MFFVRNVLSLSYSNLTRILESSTLVSGVPSESTSKAKVVAAPDDSSSGRVDSPYNLKRSKVPASPVFASVVL